MEESAKTSRHNARRSVRGTACGQPVPVSVRALTPLLSRQPCPAIRLVRWYRDPRGRFAPHLRAVAAAACVRRFGAMCSDAHSLGARTRLCAASLDSRAGRNDSGMGGQDKNGASTAAAYALPARPVCARCAAKSGVRDPRGQKVVQLKAGVGECPQRHQSELSTRHQH